MSPFTVEFSAWYLAKFKRHPHPEDSDDLWTSEAFDAGREVGRHDEAGK